MESKVETSHMQGWLIPPPKHSAKSKDDFARERTTKVGWLIANGYLRSERIKAAMLKVRREEFIPPRYRDYAYEEVPLPLPGEEATISCPHSYPLFYEPLGLDKAHRFLEVGLGSGYGTALAREIVGAEGLVVGIEIDPRTLAFAKRNLEKAGYQDIVLVRGDGGLGCPEKSPYDRIAMTAACSEVPGPLIEQLRSGGKLIAPVIRDQTQDLVLLDKRPDGSALRRTICEVMYVPLRGIYGIQDERLLE
ncbi:MAG: protein-L-isoaspartate O-methyltransferase [Gammaproteobacteria bacterium]|nr:protein-L-isoaspartate O-methyltransferase [Gammaproteobacteria bacterium]NIV52851.1 protein-L-isoaspartate O-methyltransferase [Gammaproteobacteria bacterium]NIX86509.1 protein-L-isoaspartate O-methyltransferase [Gammaproteobacteria bacterium]